ncbi:MAG: hypothetical protein J5898_07945 [Lachnospiraceae bacterium]|nr:hypothetical protein [Lachnospiraceae bacterium]
MFFIINEISERCKAEIEKQIKLYDNLSPQFNLSVP